MILGVCRSGRPRIGSWGNEMRFHVMGPIEVWREGREVELQGSKITTVLAVLVLSRGRVVSDTVLADLLWGEAPPATAQAQIQTYVSRLRGLLGPEVRIERQRPGYRISSKLHSLDLVEFEQLTALGRHATASGRPDQASAHFTAALALWRGPALAGASEFLLSAEGPQLEEARLVVLEDRIDADLEDGRHAELIAELMALVSAHPHRERPRAQLMCALHRCGRLVEALEVYHEYRRLLVNDLGLEPGRLLQEVHHRVLTDDSTPSSGQESGSSRGVLSSVSVAQAAPTVTAKPVFEAGPARGGTPAVPPAQLPPPPADFTGRTAELDEVCTWLANRDDHEGAPAVCTVLGMPGIGKTALALHAAHRLRTQYPDGQVYIDLDAANRSAGPAGTLRDLLGALGVDAAAMPESLGELARYYRSCVSGRRLLIVIGNARSEDEIRPLLPGTSGCGVLVTSRGRLAALEGARSVILGELSHEESLELLTRIVGPRRTAREPQAASRIVELCAGHPLAVRVSGARLAARPHWTLARLAGRLADQDRILDELELGDLRVRARIEETYAACREDARRTLLALATLGTSPFPLSLAVLAVGKPAEETQNLIDELVDHHLLMVHDDAEDCYRMHPLTWVMAWEHAHAEGMEPLRVDDTVVPCVPAGGVGHPLSAA
ncbi:BTAD domain-containing putative transcriptional regulator [Streptomyces sp. NPDC048191]|uniref:AfsR/SARP family transcriptional regulator n=1 Tax=Streptomyces sp. NPDC048191 TaxID=3155484 RepID=UPI0033D881F0